MAGYALGALGAAGVTAPVGAHANTTPDKFPLCQNYATNIRRITLYRGVPGSIRTAAAAALAVTS